MLKKQNIDCITGRAVREVKPWRVAGVIAVTSPRWFYEWQLCIWQRTGWHRAEALTRIREVLGSNLSRVIGYPDTSFRSFSQSLQACPGIVSQLGHGQNPFHIHHFNHPTLYSLATDSVADHSGRAV
jgi:hypothetical protein